MNAHDRRKFRRRSGKNLAKPQFIKGWEDLAKVPRSETHHLVINLENGNGWIHRNDGKERFGRYLSTHTFYGSCHMASTRLLRRCGFNVTLANWDAPE